SELKEIFNDFIENVFNKYPSNGKILQGRSSDELWAEEFREKRVVSKDALKLFCTRTSKTFSITRNGVKDSELGITYWADWMIGVKGEKVYLRRDIKNYNEAWIFKADNDEFIGKAQVSELVPALASTEIEKSEFKEAMAVKKRNKKIAKAYAKTQETDVNDRMLNLKAAVGDKEYKAEPKISKIANTKMDKVIRKQNDIEKIGTYDLSGFVDKKPEKRKIYLFESDKELDELAMGAGYGS
ncbi:MAG TPA: Mu transposase C-terminal domain-containing protein, partial [Candidatus Gastranaerophilales bacterium]|nr:Mu transposase C-terminal domain-containing protein [Candidatus Gastranaerophilales bacterium]